MKQFAVKSFLLVQLLCCAFLLRAQEADSIRLSQYRPVSIYHVPVTHVEKASFPLLDLHSHDYARNEEQIDEWVKTMDSCNIAQTMILTYNTGKGFDSAVQKYKKYPKRFLIWCGLDFTGYGTEGWSKHAVAELERCYKMGARGVGELGDKGNGENYSVPAHPSGIHIDDPAVKPILEKCAELKIPVSIHVAEDQWMYEKPDSTNDGLLNAAKWHVTMDKPGKLGHDELIAGLEKAVRENPKTTFIAFHLANSCANLEVIGRMLEKYPNLYADIAARYAEISPTPRATADFIVKHQDKIVYGTDMGMNASMYRITFRILESADEHLYEFDQFGYHWPLYGLHLPAAVLKKVYSTNALKILNNK